MDKSDAAYCFLSQFAGMIEVHHHVDASIHQTMLLEDLQESRVVGYPRRIEDRQFGAYANDLDVIDGAQVGQDLVQALIGEHQRVAACEQDVVDLRTLADVLQAFAHVT